jgi:excisionase family DNA binding protein
MDDRELIDVREASRITGLDKQTLYKLARQGRIRSFRILGRSLRFDRYDLLNLATKDPNSEGALS